MKPVSVVIPTYNGKELLEKNLPLLFKAIAGHSHPVEVIVADDGSTDATVEFIRQQYPTVIIFASDVNLGFAANINRGLRAARHDIILALNNDIQVGEDLFQASLQWFNDPEVFSVTPNMVDPRRGDCQSFTRFKAGTCWFGTWYLQPGDFALTGEIPIFYGSGGASFYDRNKLLALDGFDTIYHPFYIEDLDLSYRAWKAGWKCLFEPKTTVYHETSSTILNLHKKRKIKFIGDRNRHLFLWLNFSDPLLVIRYLLCLPLSLLYDLVSFRKYKFVGFFRALTYLRQIPALRRKRSALFRVTDKAVLAHIGRVPGRVL